MKKYIKGFIQPSFIELQLCSRADTSCYAHKDEEELISYHNFKGVVVLLNRQIYVALVHRRLFRCHSRGVYAVLGSPGKVPVAQDTAWRVNRGWWGRDRSFGEWRDNFQICGAWPLWRIWSDSWWLGKRIEPTCYKFIFININMRDPEQPEGH